MQFQHANFRWALKAYGQDDGADAAGDVDLRVFQMVKAGGTASTNKTLVVVANADLTAVGVAAEREIYSGSSRSSKDDRVVSE